MVTGWMVLTALVLLAGCGAWWWWKTHPDVRCGWCRGSGRNPLSTKWRRGRCRHCDGTGLKKKEK